MPDVKYIRTDKNTIILFHEYHLHKDFKQFNPRSAGMVTFNMNENGEMRAETHGESTSLKLYPLPDDAQLINRQILGYSD